MSSAYPRSRSLLPTDHGAGQGGENSSNTRGSSSAAAAWTATTMPPLAFVHGGNSPLPPPPPSTGTRTGVATTNGGAGGGQGAVANGGHSLAYTYSPLDYSSGWQQTPAGLMDVGGGSSGSLGGGDGGVGVILPSSSGGGGGGGGGKQSKMYRLAVKRTMVSIALSCCFGLATMAFRGRQSGLEFFAGYLVEQSLSVDNLFVFLMTFDYFQVPLEHQGRVLTWGIVGAILMRGVMIAFGVAAVKRFQWITVVFAAILLVSSYKLLVEDEEEDHDLSQNTLVRMSKRLVGAVDEYDGDRFFTRLGGKGKTVATPLLLCLVCIELSDFVFAVDSIPAVLGISQDPFVVFSSNLFAIMALRSIYVIIAQAVSQLPYLKPAVALVLGFVGCKMLLEYVHIKISTGWSLFVVMSLIGGGVGLSLLARRRQAPVVRHKRRNSGEEVSLQSPNGGGGGGGGGRGGGEKAETHPCSCEK